MSRVPSEMSPRRREAALDRQYRAIGISAVAAALPYSGDRKNPAYAPADLSLADRAENDETPTKAA